MLAIIFTYTIRGSIDFHLDFVFVFTYLIGLHVYKLYLLYRTILYASYNIIRPYTHPIITKIAENTTYITLPLNDSCIKILLIINIKITYWTIKCATIAIG